MKLFPLFALGCLLATSCSLQATVRLGSDGSAEGSATVQLAPEARVAWNSLRELDPTLPVDPLKGSNRVSLSVKDLGRYVTGWETQGSVWEGSVDRSSIARWAEVAGWGDSPVLPTLVPSPGDAVTEADYRDLLVYLLGPSVSGAEGRRLVDGSTVELTVVAPQPVRAAPGSASIAGTSVVYRWPLVRLLTLSKPLVLRLEF